MWKPSRPAGPAGALFTIAHDRHLAPLLHLSVSAAVKIGCQLQRTSREVVAGLAESHRTKRRILKHILSSAIGSSPFKSYITLHVNVPLHVNIKIGRLKLGGVLWVPAECLLVEDLCRTRRT